MAPGPLPFSGFLDVLRTKGFGVGLTEYMALGRLIDCWDRAHGEEFGDAVAALVGRSEDEVRAIRRLFAETYLTAPPQRTVSADERPPFVIQRWTWAAAAATAVVIAVVIWATYLRPPAAPPPPRTSTPEAPVLSTTQPAVTPVAPPPPPPPTLPDPPTRLERRVVAPIVGTAFLVCLAVFWALKTRETTRKWVRETWASALAALPGPFHFPLVLRDRPAALPRTDVEDAATILGRTFTPEAQARELDVPRSVRFTLRRGLLPQLVFKPRRTARTILVFQDISQDMRMWRSKVDTFLGDLRRQGVALERWYFDGDPRRVADSPYRAGVRFETALRRRPESPVLVISAGGGIESVRATGDEAWLDALAQAPRKSWLTPVADLRLWPDAFAALPVDVWPMTREGLARAARELAGIEGEPRAALRAHIAAAGQVTEDDVERLKQLASVVPHPTTELLNVLRQRFAPDVSDAALLYVLSQAEGVLPPVVRLSDEEVARSLETMRRDTPMLEAAVRRTVLRVLLDSQPVAGSAAHERWQLSVALQQLQIAELDASDPSKAIEALRRLGMGPLWEEVRKATAQLPPNSTLARRLDAALGKSRSGRAQPPDPTAALDVRQPWAWPGLREIVPAAVSASIVFGVGQVFGVFPARAVEHVRDAYTLTFVPRVPPAQSELLLQSAGTNPTLPSTVDLFQDLRPFTTNVRLAAGAPTAIPLTSADTGRYYQARATLPGRNLAVSNAVWVPSDTAVVVLIDALPWANVRLQSGSTTIGPEATPFSASLVPGQYRLTLDNGGVTPPTTQTIDVTPTNRVFRFTMPGFDPARTASDLSGTASKRD